MEAKNFRRNVSRCYKWLRKVRLTCELRLPFAFRKGKSIQGIEPGIHVQSAVTGLTERDTDAKRIEEIADHLKIEYEKKYNNIEYPYQTVDSFIEPELNSTVYILDAKRKYNKTSQTPIIDSIPVAQKLGSYSDIFSDLDPFTVLGDFPSLCWFFVKLQSLD